MLKKYFKTIPLALSITALFLSACSANITNAATQTQAIAAIYTAAAQTIEAQATKAPTSTPLPTATEAPTITPTPTLTSAPTPIPPTSPMQNYCDNALFVSDISIPDNTLLAPGQAFEKTWALLNNGTCTWSEGYTITFVSGDIMNGVARSINQTVPSQQQANITLRLTAPVKPGTYTGYWRMANSKGAPFGQIISVVIKVGADGATTVTATSAATSAATTAAATATVTPTSPAPPAATETPTPTVTPTATP